MRTYNMHEAKTNLSRLVEEAVNGEPFVIARAGKPLVKVVRIDEKKDLAKKRIGFMKGRMTIPDDIKTPFAKEIEEMFYGKK